MRKKESLNGKEIKRAVVLITVVPLHVILELAGKIHNNTLNACECEQLLMAVSDIYHIQLAYDADVVSIYIQEDIVLYLGYLSGISNVAMLAG